jgi:3-hydroxyisobutyrate dehydrogenase-like beta-hydroxyacid dehydrogenase
MSQQIGFIGLGSMGTRIVRLLLESDFDVTVWARRAASVEPLAGLVTVVNSPAAVGSAADLVGVCVWDEHDVEEVLLAEHGVFAGLAPGGTVMVHSTIPPSACQRLAALGSDRGINVLDVPVSVGANAPKVLAMIGGDPAVVEAARPALEAFGSPAVHLGPLGSGQIAKLVNNTMLAATVGIGANALALGAALGLDEHALLSVLSVASSGGTWTGLLRRRRDAPAGNDVAGRTNEWATKDVALATRLIEEHGGNTEYELVRAARLGATALS